VIKGTEGEGATFSFNSDPTKITKYFIYKDRYLVKRKEGTFSYSKEHFSNYE
jgi:hypothetical protein